MTLKRRPSRKLDDLPSLFDMVDLDMSHVDVADEVVADHERHVAESAYNHGVEIDTEGLKRGRRLRFISFGSGSSGNCAFVGDEREGVLIDAGVDSDTVFKRLEDNAIPLRSIKGILLTHDHSDHLRAAYKILRSNRHMVLYCTPRTLNGIFRRSSISRRIRDYHRPIYKEMPFNVGSMTVTAFETSHDGTDNMGFAIDYEDNHFVVATDTGFITERADYYIRRANYLMIEANYDQQLLTDGFYPNYLKARIQGPKGHMDNAETARYLAEIHSPALTHVFLCHLSKDNNTPEIALSAVTDALKARGLRVGDAVSDPIDAPVDVRVDVLPRYDASPMYILRRR